MQSEKGIWKISAGKGDRVYINCINESKIMHPQSLCENNGMGIYGYENLKDLAIAILLFEKEKQKSESIEKFELPEPTNGKMNVTVKNYGVVIAENITNMNDLLKVVNSTIEI